MGFIFFLFLVQALWIIKKSLWGQDQVQNDGSVIITKSAQTSYGSPQAFGLCRVDDWRRGRLVDEFEEGHAMS